MGCLTASIFYGLFVCYNIEKLYLYNWFVCWDVWLRQSSPVYLFVAILKGFIFTIDLFVGMFDCVNLLRSICLLQYWKALSLQLICLLGCLTASIFSCLFVCYNIEKLYLYNWFVCWDVWLRQSSPVYLFVTILKSFIFTIDLFVGLFDCVNLLLSICLLQYWKALSLQLICLLGCLTASIFSCLFVCYNIEKLYLYNWFVCWDVWLRQSSPVYLFVTILKSFIFTIDLFVGLFDCVNLLRSICLLQYWKALSLQLICLLGCLTASIFSCLFVCYNIEKLYLYNWFVCWVVWLRQSSTVYLFVTILKSFIFTIDLFVGMFDCVNLLLSICLLQYWKALSLQLICLLGCLTASIFYGLFVCYNFEKLNFIIDLFVGMFDCVNLLRSICLLQYWKALSLQLICLLGCLTASIFSCLFVCYNIEKLYLYNWFVGLDVWLRQSSPVYLFVTILKSFIFTIDLFVGMFDCVNLLLSICLLQYWKALSLQLICLLGCLTASIFSCLFVCYNIEKLYLYNWFVGLDVWLRQSSPVYLFVTILKSFIFTIDLFVGMFDCVNLLLSICLLQYWKALSLQLICWFGCLTASIFSCLFVCYNIEKLYLYNWFVCWVVWLRQSSPVYLFVTILESFIFTIDLFVGMFDCVNLLLSICLLQYWKALSLQLICWFGCLTASIFSCLFVCYNIEKLYLYNWFVCWDVWLRQSSPVYLFVTILKSFIFTIDLFVGMFDCVNLLLSICLLQYWKALSLQLICLLGCLTASIFYGLFVCYNIEKLYLYNWFVCWDVWLRQSSPVYLFVTILKSFIFTIDLFVGLFDCVNLLRSICLLQYWKALSLQLICLLGCLTASIFSCLFVCYNIEKLYLYNWFVCWVVWLRQSSTVYLFVTILKSFIFTIDLFVGMFDCVNLLLSICLLQYWKALSLQLICLLGCLTASIFYGLFVCYNFEKLNFIIDLFVGMFDCVNLLRSICLLQYWKALSLQLICLLGCLTASIFYGLFVCYNIEKLYLYNWFVGLDVWLRQSSTVYLFVAILKSFIFTIDLFVGMFDCVNLLLSICLLQYWKALSLQLICLLGCLTASIFSCLFVCYNIEKLYLYNWFVCWVVWLRQSSTVYLFVTILKSFIFTIDLFVGMFDCVNLLLSICLLQYWKALSLQLICLLGCLTASIFSCLFVCCNIEKLYLYNWFVCWDVWLRQSSPVYLFVTILKSFIFTIDLFVGMFDCVNLLLSICLLQYWKALSLQLICLLECLTASIFSCLFVCYNIEKLYLYNWFVCWDVWLRRSSPVYLFVYNIEKLYLYNWFVCWDVWLRQSSPVYLFVAILKSFIFTIDLFVGMFDCVNLLLSICLLQYWKALSLQLICLLECLTASIFSCLFVCYNIEKLYLYNWFVCWDVWLRQSSPVYLFVAILKGFIFTIDLFVGLFDCVNLLLSICLLQYWKALSLQLICLLGCLTASIFSCLFVCCNIEKLYLYNWFVCWVVWLRQSSPVYLFVTILKSFIFTIDLFVGMFDCVNLLLSICLLQYWKALSLQLICLLECLTASIFSCLFVCYNIEKLYLYNWFVCWDVWLRQSSPVYLFVTILKSFIFTIDLFVWMFDCVNLLLSICLLQYWKALSLQLICLLGCLTASIFSCLFVCYNIEKLYLYNWFVCWDVCLRQSSPVYLFVTILKSFIFTIDLFVGMFDCVNLLLSICLLQYWKALSLQLICLLGCLTASIFSCLFVCYNIEKLYLYNWFVCWVVWLRQSSPVYLFVTILKSFIFTIDLLVWMFDCVNLLLSICLLQYWKALSLQLICLLGCLTASIFSCVFVCYNIEKLFLYNWFVCCDVWLCQSTPVYLFVTILKSFIFTIDLLVWMFDCVNLLRSICLLQFWKA